jgi:probable rRNA maturation factor
MNRVNINAEEVPLPSWSGQAGSFALKVLNEIKHNNWQLSVLLCGDKTITGLNAKYRNKAEATDILSFNMGETIKEDGKTIYLPGDIIISLDTLSKNAEYFQIPEDEELRRLLIHGILHLDGMDHNTLDKNEPMLVLQEDILNRLETEHIIPNGGEK